MILSKIQPASVKVRILRTAATLIGYFDSFMFEFIVSNFGGAVQNDVPVLKKGPKQGLEAEMIGQSLKRGRNKDWRQKMMC